MIYCSVCKKPLKLAVERENEPGILYCFACFACAFKNVMGKTIEELIDPMQNFIDESITYLDKPTT